ncbi:MAG: hypothetical protein J6Y28_02490 [Acholeplasmatales bacterium]|nr:hypothetical protein [Acholeplasmatales bacterium]
MNIFDVVPANFFSILASKNKSIYYDCLKRVYDLYDKKMGFDVTREEAMDELIDYFDESPDFQEDDEVTQTPREKANYVLNRLYQTGWLVLETDNNYNDLVSFRYYALTVLEGFDRIAAPKEEEESDYAVFEYKGYLFSIYSLLTKSSNEELNLVINQVARLALEFIAEIKKINLKLRDYITSISQNTGVRELMEKLIDYKTQLVDKSYQRLKTFDNVDRYKRRILEKLEEIYGNDILMNKLIGAHMIDKGSTREEAEFAITRSINDTIDIFNNLDDLIDEIEQKNKVYVNSTITKIKFLLNNETDTLGKLNYILKFMTKDQGMTEHQLMSKIENLFTISQQQALQVNSLQSPKIMTRPIESSALTVHDRPDLDELQKAFLEAYNSKFSEVAIKKFVDMILSKASRVKASELFGDKIDTDGITRLLYVLVYGTTNDGYNITKLNEKYETEKFLINDFEIARR